MSLNEKTTDKNKQHKKLIGKKLIAGNWKMNLDQRQACDLAANIAQSYLGLGDAGQSDSNVSDSNVSDSNVSHSGLTDSGRDVIEYLICPSHIYMSSVFTMIQGKGAGKTISLGGQDCAGVDDGAYTGDISARMLAGQGCSYVILGHSERRAGYGEEGVLLTAKIKQAYAHGLHVILCVGEDLSAREAGKALDVVSSQLNEIDLSLFDPEKMTIAYEPVWAIGTGKTAQTADIEQMHAHIRAITQKIIGENMNEKLENTPQMRILYGGSVKPSNAYDIFCVENVDGALIGGASLNPIDFTSIGQAGIKAWS